jgi:hypothetical protein
VLNPLAAGVGDSDPDDVDGPPGREDPLGLGRRELGLDQVGDEPGAQAISEQASYWCGIVAPRNTSVEIIDKLNKKINAGLADTKMKARFADLGATVLAGSPAQYGKLIAVETEKWAKVIKFAGIKAE